MYSRSRSCLSKGKLQVPDLVKPQLRPNAPLEFLYPRWFAQSPATSKLPRPDTEFHDFGKLERQGHEQAPTITRKVKNKHSTRTERMQRQARDTGQCIFTTNTELKELQAVRRHKTLALLVQKRQQNKAVAHSRNDSNANLVSHESVLEVRKIKTNGSETPSQRALKRMLMKVKHNPKHIVWTVPARILSDAMQLPAQREREGILLRERTILELTGTAHENIWIHNSNGGCEVHVLPRAPGSSGERDVLLHGSQAAMELTKAYLRAQDTLLHASSRTTDEDFEGPIRWELSDSGFNSGAEDALRADQLPVPSQWSVKTFAQYVEDLCTLRMARGLQRELYPGEETLHQNVAAVLEEIFTTEELTPHFSSHAFNLALNFTTKHNELSSTRELLYGSAKRLGLNRQTRMYNIMIEGAMKMNRMDNLRGLVKDMLAAGVVPDGMTWSNLLLVSPSPVSRRHIFDFIFRVYSDDFPAVMAYLAKRLVENEMVSLVEKPEGLQHFLERMDTGFGPGWLTSQTLYQVLRTCADHRLWKTADDMLDVAAERGVEMQPSTLRALMYLHYRRGDLNAIIDLLQSRGDLLLGYHSTYAVHWAFLTAWKQKRYNVCRVLWQYAATRGLISYQMQSRVYSSLIQNQHLAALPEHQSWKSLAGKLVIGTDLDTTNFDTQFPRLSKYFSTTKDPLQWLGQWTPNNGTRDEQMSLVYVMMHRDLEAWKVLKPMSRSNLTELLNAARRKDQAWVLEKFDEHATLAEMLANAIKIPLTIAQQNRASVRMGGQPSLPAATRLGQQISATTLTSWTPFQQTDLFSKVTMSADPLLALSRGCSRSINVLFTVLQTRSHLSGLKVLSIWHLLAQRLGLQDARTAV